MEIVELVRKTMNEFYEEKKTEIIYAAVEESLKVLPEVFANLLDETMRKLKISKSFYDKYPEFKNHHDVVARVVQELDEKSPGKPFDKLVEEAVPLIRNRLDIMAKL